MDLLSPYTQGWSAANRRIRRLLPPGLLGNLIAGVRGALFLRVPIDSLSTHPGDLALIAVVDVICNLVSSLILLGRDGTFNYSALPAFFFHIPLMLLCGYLASRVYHRPELVTALPVAFIAISLPVEFSFGLLEWGAAHLPRLRWLEEHLHAPNYYRFFWWWSAASLVFVFRLGPGARRRLAALTAFLFFVVTPLWFYPRSDLWLSPAEEGGESGELKVTEEVLSAQSRLLDDELTQLARGRNGEPSLYFVGFAGDASQDVFLKELSAAEHLFADRFDAGDRTVILANNPETGTSLPFATGSNLNRALAAVGKAMNKEDDVLFLYLTSHGSRDHELTIANGPLTLDQLTPETVRRMLKNSGIRWRVLVVSACYSGGFIEPLKDDNTLIITAADATHESFGCGYGERFTWFGEAFFGALERTYSFTKAFETARETIRKWEEEQGETPSNPQIWVGKEIEKKLAPLEKRLAAQASPTSPSQ